MAVNYAVLRHEPHRAKPHIVVINVDGQRRAKSFPTKVAATRYQTKLNRAVSAGEEFDPATGQPVSWSEEAQAKASVAATAARIVAERWTHQLPASRRGMIEGLAHVIAATTANRDRGVVYTVACHGLNPRSRLCATELDVWRAVQQTSPQVASLDYAQVGHVLAANLDGSPAVASTRTKRVQWLGAVVEMATGKRPNKRRARGTKNAITDQVSPIRIGTITEALLIIAQVLNVGVRRALLLMLYAGLRPSEAIALRWEHVDLGTGILTVTDNTPAAGSAYTDSGNSSDVQPPKWRPRGSARTVPLIEPLLVEILRWAEDDGRPTNGLVCTSAKGTAIPTNDLSNCWRPIREEVGATWAEERLARPYDLRHLHASVALNAGTPIPEVAARLGHSPAELLNTYAAVIETDQPRWTSVMSEAFTTG